LKDVRRIFRISNNLIIDSVIWIASIFKGDQKHKHAKTIIKWAQKQDKYGIIITNLICAEVANFLTRKKKYKEAKEIVQMFKTHEKIDFYFDDETMSDHACEYFNKIDRIGYVDASIIAFYVQLKCKYILSFDSGFDGINNQIIRLENIPT
jgi:predicted nucleic acid-binding protein